MLCLSLLPSAFLVLIQSSTQTLAFLIPYFHNSNSASSTWTLLNNQVTQDIKWHWSTPFHGAPEKHACSASQLCPTFCNPRGLQPTRLLCPQILQARILEWVAISFSEILTILLYFKLYYTKGAKSSFSLKSPYSILSSFPQHYPNPRYRIMCRHFSIKYGTDPLMLHHRHFIIPINC